MKFTILIFALLAGVALTGCAAHDNTQTGTMSLRPVEYPCVNAGFLSALEWPFVGPYRAGRPDRPGDCMDVVGKLEDRYPERAGCVFWSDDGHYDVIGNENGTELMHTPGSLPLNDGPPYVTT